MVALRLYLFPPPPLLQALNFQQRAVYIYERVLGVDHRLTVTGYIQLAIYCQDADQVRVALRVMYRARYLLRLNCTEDHPDVATCDVRPRGTPLAGEIQFLFPFVCTLVTHCIIRTFSNVHTYKYVGLMCKAQVCNMFYTTAP